MTVAIVGAGEMGAAVGRRLRESGARVVTSIAGRSAGASRAFVVPASRWSTTTIRLCATRASCFRSFRLASPSSRRTSSRSNQPRESTPVFVECNAISPATCRRIRDLLDATNFIDAGIIGGPPVAGIRPRKGSPLLRIRPRRLSDDAARQLWSRRSDSRLARWRRVRLEAVVRRADQGLHRTMRDDARCGRTRGTD